MESSVECIAGRSRATHTHVLRLHCVKRDIVLLKNTYHTSQDCDLLKQNEYGELTGTAVVRWVLLRHQVDGWDGHYLMVDVILNERRSVPKPLAEFNSSQYCLENLPDDFCRPPVMTFNFGPNNCARSITSCILIKSIPNRLTFCGTLICAILQ